MRRKIKPFCIELNENWMPRRYNKKLQIKLSDLRKLFCRRDLVEEILSSGKDPVIYEVYQISQSPSEGVFSAATTVLYPGKIGDEYYFTKGHFHLKEPRGEVYIGLAGRGLLLLQDRNRKIDKLSLNKGEVAFIPPNYAHRAVNIGDEKMVFLSIYPSDAGHDYEIIEREGFSKIVVGRKGKVALVDNPK
jgi:glucose-6-phosphate isomerase